MKKLLIRGGKQLKGQVKISGSKNAALPIMAASILSNKEVVLTGVPDLEDVKVMSEALEHLGAKIRRNDDELYIDTRSINSYEVPDHISRKMRASNLLMGALLGKFQEAKISYPGGCAIGLRPMDLHIKGFNKLGYKINEESGFMRGTSIKLEATDIVLDFPSVGATENIMMAAVRTPGTTFIRNAAREPEIIDLQNFLNRMGAKIRGAGLDTIRVEGVNKLGSAEHIIIPDRIEAGTFMAFIAITSGDVWIENSICEHLKAMIAKLSEIGAEIISYDRGIRVIGRKNYHPNDFKTMPYPGFPTDMQAQFMALLASVPGTSVIVETIFENRFMHVQELRRMGADIKVEGRVAIVKGKEKLEGAKVEASDLRAGAALITAALKADDETIITGIEHIDRGYEKIESKLKELGADIKSKND